jgi:hypothetical protein
MRARRSLLYTAWLLCMLLPFTRAQNDCYSNADCNGGVCAQVAGTPAMECRSCPGDQRGLRCEQFSNIILSNQCSPSCSSGRCLLNSKGVPVCADMTAGMITTFLPNATLSSTTNATYGPYVCGITAPCQFNPTYAKYVPIGTCPTSYTLTMFPNAFDPSNKNCGPSGLAADVCLKGAFMNDRVFQTTADANSGYYSTMKNILVQCSKIDNYLPQYPTVAGTHSALLLSYYGITASGPGPMCADIPGKCATGTCVRQTGDYQITQVSPGVWRTIASRDICCPLGRIGNQCEIDSGCTVTGCLHGGSCLRVDKYNRTLLASDTRCFGCATATNSTPGYQGIHCEFPTQPTFLTLGTATTSSRRLLQVNSTVLVRNPIGYTSPSSGVIYKEPSRVCDCGVTWSGPFSPTGKEKVMQMGNVPSFPTTSTLLSVIKYNPLASGGVKPYVTQQVNNLAQAQYLCYRGWSCDGVLYNNKTKQFQAVMRLPPPWLVVNYTAATVTPFPTLLFYNITRVQDKTRCLNATLDPVFYCNTYPLQCQALRDQGGVGNVLAFQNSPVSLVAWLHFEAFGHTVRNKPNANCDLTTQLAEDQQGCNAPLRAPKAFYALAPGQALTSAICGNASRIDPTRVMYGPLQQGSTGVSTTNGMDSVCLCYPPFRAADTSKYQDCSYDLCGIVDGRGKVNATYANALAAPSHFNHSDPTACVCFAPWATDPTSCSTGTTCNWCSATACQNGGTVNPANFSAGCACNPVFTGDRCQTSLCNANHTRPFNYTQWVAAGHLAEQIVCDCLPGWTGTYCDHPQCIYGQFNFETDVCDCTDGYFSSTDGGGTCDMPLCAATHGVYIPAHFAFAPITVFNTYVLTANYSIVNSTTVYVQVAVDGACSCQPPWAGPRCVDHTCDDYNIVQTFVPDFAGVRPFGIPQLSPDNDATWECGCNWPYIPLNVAEGRPLDCAAHDCNYGLPNSNAALVVDPTDACTCQASSVGLFSDPSICTGFSHDACPNACLRGTCGLSSSDLEQTGSVEIGDSPTCCRCSASQGYNINGQCQAFCAFYQPCLTTALSGFKLNPDYNASLTYDYANPDIAREADGNDQYVCVCKSNCADYIDAQGVRQPCSNCTLEVRDTGYAPITVSYGLAPPDTAGSTTPTDTTQKSNSLLQSPGVIAAICVAAGLLVLGLAVAVFQASQEAEAVVASAAIAGVAMQSVTQPFFPPNSTTTTTTTTTVKTTSNTAGKSSRRAARAASLLVLLCINVQVCVLCQAQNALPDGFVYPASNHWDRWYTGTDASSARILLTIEGGGGLHPAPAGGSSNLYCNNKWALNTGSFNSYTRLGIDLNTCSGVLTHYGGRYTHMEIYYIHSWAYSCQYTTQMAAPIGQFPGFGNYSPRPGVTIGRLYNPVPVMEHRYATYAIPHLGKMRFAQGQAEVSVSWWGLGNPGYVGDGTNAQDYYGVQILDTVPSMVQAMYNLPSNCNAHENCGIWSSSNYPQMLSQCGGHGTGVMRWLDTSDTSMVTSDANTNGASGYCSTFGISASQPDSLCTSHQTAGATMHQTQLLYVRGCQCNSGYYGLVCDQVCPPPQQDMTLPSPLCSMQGICNSTASAITKTQSDGVHYCKCPASCLCLTGFTGPSCETAVFTSVALISLLPTYPNVLDFSECCPLNHTNCMPIVSRVSNEGLVPTTRCPANTCMPNAGLVGETVVPDTGQWSDSFRATLGTTQAVVSVTAYDGTTPVTFQTLATVAPFRCGENSNKAVAGWIPTRGFLAGHGQCDLGQLTYTYTKENGFSAAAGSIDTSVIPSGTGFCWCNNLFRTPSNNNVYHGWWGTGCKQRTCTTTWNNARSLDSTGVLWISAARSSSSYVGLSGMQCSNRSAVAYSDMSSNMDTVSLSNSPCDDTATVLGSSITRINTPGFCKQCIDGWGFHAGYNQTMLDFANSKDTSLHINSTYQGICDVKTQHSFSGAVCGGYGIPTTALITVPAKGSAPSYKMTQVLSCACNQTWQLTQPAANGGICQRSCAGDPTAVLATVKWSVAPVYDQYYNYIGATDVSLTYNSTAIVKCGGYRRGLCRPITDPTYGGGWNSACMCNPGFNGPQCDNQTSLWYKGTVCGPDGEFVLQQPSGTPLSPPAASADEDWFRRYIVPMNNFSALNSNMYSSYKCQCKAGPLSQNYVLNANGICGQGCRSPALVGPNGLTCSGNGQCIGDPRIDGNATAGKVCMCNLGWDGTNCARRNLRDSFNVSNGGLGRVCGGVMDAEGEDGVTPRGYIAYQDSTNLTQKCVCKPPYKPNPVLGAANALCWRDCLNNCTDALHGSCAVNITTNNDRVCTCNAGAFIGQDCSRKLLAVYTTQSGTELPCTGHGFPATTGEGYCVCDDDYLPPACAIYAPNRQCGAGQSFLDTESVGILVS